MSVKPIHPPGLPEAFDASKRDVFSSLNCVQIGKIIDFDSANQTASIELLLKQVTNIDLQGVKTFQESPTLIKKCPCLTLFGGTAFLSLPIQPGDNCLVLFNDREIDNWFVNGGTQATTTPRMHDVSDAMAIVGVRSLQESISTYLANGIRLSYGGGTAKIDLQANAINSLATLFTHTGNMLVTGTFNGQGAGTFDSTLRAKDDTTLEKDLLVEGNETIEGGLVVKGNMTGDGGTINIADNITLASGKTLTAPIVDSENGTTGTFTNSVTVLDGIVTGGT